MPETYYFTDEQVKILEEAFKKDKYIPPGELMSQLVKDSELKPDQIRSWFRRRRQKAEKAQEKQKLILLKAKEKRNDDETRAKEGEIAELAARLKEKEVEIAKLEVLLKAKDAEIESLKASAGMKDDDETRAMRLEELDAYATLELEQQTPPQVQQTASSWIFRAMDSGWDLSQDGP